MNDVLTKEQWISFYINGEIYAQPIAVVREIVPYREAAPVPGAPAEVEGIVNIRGDVISVISGRHLFDAPIADSYDDTARILIIEHGEHLLGFSVDKVSEIVGFNQEQIEYNSSESGLIKGTVNLPQGLYIVTNLGEYPYRQEDYE